MSELALNTDRQLAAEPSIGQLMQAVVSAGITPQSVEVMERLCALREREEARAAERDFAAAFAQLQADMPKIEAVKAVPGSVEGSVRYHYAPYEEIMRKARPVLSANGFAISFDTITSEDGKRVTVKCTLMHRSGHSRENSYTGRIGSGPPKASEAQSDGAGYTYAKRFALCAALNITVEQDTDGVDARNLGEFIDPAKAAELRQRAEACLKPSQVAKLVAWLGADSFEKVYSTRLEDAERVIADHERKAGKKPDLAKPEEPGNRILT